MNELTTSYSDAVCQNFGPIYKEHKPGAYS